MSVSSRGSHFGRPSAVRCAGARVFARERSEGACHDRGVRSRSSLALLFALGSISCGGVTPSGPDLFRVAAEPAGGALLSVWMDAQAPSPLGYLAGGYTGVERARVPDMLAGRLVEYTTGSFRTVCRTDTVLWWVTGVRSSSGGALTVYAAGEGGRVLRYRDGRCETLSIGGEGPRAQATLWGALAVGENDVWFVGGSAIPGGPTGVLLHYDGSTFTQESTLPAAAMRQNLYKINPDGEGGLYVVGAAGVVLYRARGATSWAQLTIDARPTDNRLFTVSCASTGSSCFAVGGAGGGMVLTGARDAWRSVDLLSGEDVGDFPGLNGVWVDGAGNAYVVGNSGFTAYIDANSAYRPPVALTSNTVHGVAGDARVVIAAGGELGTYSEAQRAVVLVRGDSSSSFRFDGVPFTPRGRARTEQSTAPAPTPMR